jgi:hypothetical protein
MRNAPGVGDETRKKMLARLQTLIRLVLSPNLDSTHLFSGTLVSIMMPSFSNCACVNLNGPSI